MARQRGETRAAFVSGRPQHGETRAAFVSGRPMRRCRCNTALPGKQIGLHPKAQRGGHRGQRLGSEKGDSKCLLQLEEKVTHIQGPVDQEGAEIYLSGEFISVPARRPLPVSVADGQHLHGPLQLSTLPRRLETLC